MQPDQFCALLVANGTPNAGANLSHPEWNQEAYQLYSLLLNGIIMTFVIISGLFGNAMTCYILSLKPMRAKINRYIITLAFWDSIVLATCWLLFSWAALQYGELPSYGSIVYCYMVFYPVSNIAKTASNWTLLITSFERFFAISKPMQHQMYNTPLRFRLIVIFTAVGTVLFNTSKFFEITIIHCPLGAGTVPAIITTPLRDSPLYFILYHVVLNLLFISFGPFCIQTILTGLISYHLRRSLRYRNRHSSFHGRKKHKKRHTLETSMNLMFVIVCIKFLICLLLPTGVNIAEMILKVTDKEQLLANGPFAFLVDLSNLLAVTNSALNFPVYVIFCSRFRMMLQVCLKCQFLRKSTGASSFLLLRKGNRSVERAITLPMLTSFYLHSNGYPVTVNATSCPALSADILEDDFQSETSSSPNRYTLLRRLRFE